MMMKMTVITVMMIIVNKVYKTVTEAHRCDKLAQSFYAMVPG